MFRIKRPSRLYTRSEDAKSGTSASRCSVDIPYFNKKDIAERLASLYGVQEYLWNKYVHLEPHVSNVQDMVDVLKYSNSDMCDRE